MMKYPIIKRTVAVVSALMVMLPALAQNSVVQEQRSYGKIAEVFNRVEDSLESQFRIKHMSWPPRSLYIRSFKHDRKLEVWVNGDFNEPYHLFKTYDVCMPSGVTGPKRMEGDLQVPEGFYYINELNPNSNYHLSLGLNYPNASDRILSDSLRPGGDIYIHGRCVSVGCIPISDAPIEELYIMAAYARTNGQDFIPVHVFPVKYDVKKSMDYLEQTTEGNATLKKFSFKLKEVFDFFEEKKQLPLISVNRKGEYVIN